MRSKKSVELDVDFIGGERDLTLEEAAAISAFIKAEKLKKAKKETSKKVDSAAKGAVFAHRSV